MDKDHRKIAVYIDLQNVPPRSIPAVFERLMGDWELVTKRAYGTALTPYRKLLGSHGILPIETASVKPGKNAADITLTADAVEELCRGQADAFCIVSGDSDFTALVSKIREQGKQVFVFGPPSTPDTLKRTCTMFFVLQRVEGKAGRWRTEQGHTGVERTDPHASRLSQKLSQLVEEFVANPGKKTVDAFSGFVKHREPTFSPKRYGARSITSLLRKFAVCDLRPLTDAMGVIRSYELVLCRSQVTDSQRALAGDQTIEVS
jgi:hypothetical protein